MWLCLLAVAQLVVAFLMSPHTAWSMIRESSRDKDLGVTLRGSMGQQALVSTLLFSTIMGKFQVNRFDLTNNVGNVSSLDPAAEDFSSGATANPDAVDYKFAEHALDQWYAV